MSNALASSTWVDLVNFWNLSETTIDLQDSDRTFKVRSQWPVDNFSKLPQANTIDLSDTVVSGENSLKELDSVFSSNLHIAGCPCPSCALPPVDPNRDKNQPLAIPSSATLDLSKTFLLNSLPGANQTIYLDFNGHITSGTIWNTSFHRTNIVTPAFDFDSPMKLGIH